VQGWTSVFRYFAADAYLYLAVGRNWAELGFPTIDQVRPTNGFHPLWQLLVAGVYALAPRISLSEPGVLVGLLLTNVASISLAIWLLCIADARTRGHAMASFLLLPVGLYGLLVLGIQTWFGPRGSLWGFANGMESGLSLLLYASLVWRMTRPGFGRTQRSALEAGILLSALLLARLDNVFLGGAFVGFYALRAMLRRDSAELRWAALAALPLLVTLAGYLASNQATVGIALPVSGLAKSTAPSLAKLGDLLGTFSAAAGAQSQWRLLQIVVPMAMAVLALWRLRGVWAKPVPGPLEALFAATAIFVLVLGSYNLLVVPTFDQGHWYFPISILFTSHYAFHLLDRLQLPWLASRAAAVTFLVVSASVFVLFHEPRPGVGPPLFEDFATRRALALQHHYGAETPRIFSYDDGIIAYATGFPVMTARGFMLDAEAIEHFRRRDLSLLDLAYRRGFDRIMAVLYFNSRGLGPESPSDRIRDQLAAQFRIPDWELARFRFAVDYVSPDGRFTVIRMERADS
jgi:hypothetical protein